MRPGLFHVHSVESSVIIFQVALIKPDFFISSRATTAMRAAAGPALLSCLRPWRHRLDAGIMESLLPLSLVGGVAQW